MRYISIPFTQHMKTSPNCLYSRIALASTVLLSVAVCQAADPVPAKKVDPAADAKPGQQRLVVGTRDKDDLTKPMGEVDPAQLAHEGSRQIQDAIKRLGVAELPIDQANEAIKELQEGLIKDQGNLEGRLFLGRLCFDPQINQPLLGARILLEGLPYGAANSQPYMEQLVRSLERTGQDEQLIGLLYEILPAKLGTPAAYPTLVISGAQALVRSQRLAEAEMLLRDYNAIETLDGAILWGQILWERGDRAKVLEMFKQLVTDNPAEDRLLSAALVYARELKDWDYAKRVASRRRILNTLSFVPAYDEVVTYALMGDTAARDASIAAYLKDYADNMEAMALLARHGVEVGQPEIALKVRADIVARKPEARLLFDLVAMESLVSANRFAEAKAEIAAIRERALPGTDAFGPTLAAREAILAYGLGDRFAGNRALTAFLRRGDLPVELLLHTARQCARLNEADGESEVLRTALSRYPQEPLVHSQWVSRCVRQKQILAGLDSLEAIGGSRLVDEDTLRKALELLKQLKADTPEDSEKVVSMKERYAKLIEVRLEQWDDLRTGRDRDKLAEAVKRGLEAKAEAKAKADAEAAAKRPAPAAPKPASR